MDTGFYRELSDHLPPAATEYCLGLARQFPFQVKLVAPRVSKLGDYRFHSGHQSHIITINKNLNPYEFLMVYLHEVAHCITTLNHGIKVRPHGNEWKENLRLLMEPVVSSQWLPAEVTEALRRYLLAPKAASCSDMQLSAALRRYDAPSSSVALDELSEGTEFAFRGQHYCKLQGRRTRVKCRNINTGKLYVISKLARVHRL